MWAVLIIADVNEMGEVYFKKLSTFFFPQAQFFQSTD